MIVSKREKVVQGVVVGIVGGLGKPIVVPGPLGMVVGRMGCPGVLLGSPRIVVGGTGIEGTLGSPDIVGRPGVAVGTPGIEGTTGTVGPIGIVIRMGTAGRGIAGLVGGTGTVGTAGIVRTGTGATGTVGTMATGGRTSNVGNLGVPPGSAGKMGMGRGKLGNPGRPVKAGNANGPLGKIPAPIVTSVPELGVTPLDGPAGRLAIAVDGTIGAVSNKLVSISVAVGISILKDFGRVCRMTFAHEYRGLGCW